MSSDSLAILRNSLGPELGALAEQHLQHDLQPTDLTALRTASKTVSLHASIGSGLGITLGSLVAFRLRSARHKVFAALRARGPAAQPTALRFADGHEQALPAQLGANALQAPGWLGGLATYGLLGAGGLFLGGETGLLTGTFRARQQIAADRDSRERIERAFRRFQADALRRRADALDRETEGEGGSGWRF